MNLTIFLLLAIALQFDAISGWHMLEKREICSGFQCECFTRFPNDTNVQLAPGSGGQKSSGSPSLSQTEKDDLVSFHNEKRASIGAADMQCLSWSDKLESLAQVHADKCTAADSLTADRQNSGKTGFDYVGENMFVLEGIDTPSMKDVINKWWDDQQNFDGNAACDGDKKCEQFTQMVWAATNTIGCAISECDSIEHVGLPGYVLVCNYGPGGNIEGSAPFQSGEACSICPPEKEACANGLCCEQEAQEPTCSVDEMPCECFTRFSNETNAQLTPGTTGKKVRRNKPLNKKEKDQLVNLHNAKRSSIGAANMQCLSWSNKLEYTAQQHSKKCTAANTETADRKKSRRTGFDYAGENIFVVEGSSRPSIDDVIDTWWADQQNFDGIAACKDGEKCEQYTQMVWAETNSIGCALTDCDSIEHVGSPGYVLVCNYGPGGNIEGVAPFQTGEECSACPTERNACVYGLCCDSYSLQLTCGPNNELFQETCFTEPSIPLRVKRASENEPGAPGVKGQGEGLDDEEKLQLINGHNGVRSTLGASDMQCLTWLTELENSAQATADACSAKGSSLASRSNSSDFSYIGENAYISLSSQRPAIDDVLKKWTLYADDPTFVSTRSCKDIADPAEADNCWEFSQVVWANTEELGCAISYCDNLEYIGEPGWIAVCHYGPGGNIAEAEAFQVGQACSACPSSIKNECNDNLCCEKTLEGAADTCRSSGTFYSRREMCKKIRGYGYCKYAEIKPDIAQMLDAKCSDPFSPKCFCCEE